MDANFTVLSNDPCVLAVSYFYRHHNKARLFLFLGGGGRDLFNVI